MFKNIFLVSVLISISVSQVKGQLIADAGADVHICSQDDFTQLGGNLTAFGGIPPYQYKWSFWYFDGVFITNHASDFLNDTSSANPTIFDYVAENQQNIPYVYLEVTDAIGNIAYDSVKVTFSKYYIHIGYEGHIIAPGDSVYLATSNISGGTGTLSYIWRPNHGLIDSIGLGVWAKPDTSIKYYTVVTDTKGCTHKAPPYYYITVSEIGISEDIIPNKTIHIFPNPATEKISISTHDFITIKKISLIDLAGKTHKQWDGSLHTTLDLSNVSAGFYQLILETNKGRYREAVIIN